MRLGKIFFFSLVIFIFMFSLVLAGRLENITKEVDALDVDKLEIDCEFGLGELIIHPEDIKKAAILDIAYDLKKFDFEIDYTKRGNTGYLNLESFTRKHHNLNIDSDDNSWNLTLSNLYPAEINFDLGACEADIDLGGIPLKDLSLHMGAASGIIDFSKPNPERMRELVIEVGASSLEINNLGNAHFDFLKVACGAASCDLDLRGDFTGEAEFDLEVGVGSVDLILPRHVAVNIEADEGMFSSIDFHNDNLEEIDDDLYQSPNFDTAKDKIYINIEVGMGSVDIYWK